MIEDTQHPIRKKKKRRSLRALGWVAVLVAVVLGLGFFVSRGDLDISETISTVREISEDATNDLRETVDTAVRTDSGRQKLLARVAELEERVSNLESGSGGPMKSSDKDSSDKDTRLGRRIEFELFSTGAFDLQTIAVAVADGQVRLTGAVRSEAERVLAQRIAEEAAGVTQVVNELRIVESELRQTGG